MSKFTEYLGKIISKGLETFKKSLTDDIRKLTEEIQKTNRKIDENEKDRIRWEILSFANSCRAGQNHVKDEFQHIMDLNDKYILLLQETNDKNGIFEVEYEYIVNLYKQKITTNDFLDTLRKED